ncbi:hypothetical protein L596_003587 [Steinernema carpocapsae]|uniref:Uncharacterized protein n=1 Tax=Steinernema carpocapsae TaxID=34508 RepID=A0A4U8UUP7_STECR|nr:hypothetical protein L596_003587 [Steinernema carpocapsae]
MWSKWPETLGAAAGFSSLAMEWCDGMVLDRLRKRVSMETGRVWPRSLAQASPWKQAVSGHGHACLCPPRLGVVHNFRGHLFGIFQDTYNFK